MITLLCLPWLAHAREAQFLYTKTQIGIQRAHGPQVVGLPWQQSAPLMLNAEVRNADILYQQEGWFNFDSLAENSGLLLTFDVPQTAPIVPMTQYAPLDIAMIDATGQIIQIVPNIKLSELEQNINPPAPILAFLFLSGGACAKLGIMPGDHIEYRIFKKPPPTLGLPAASQAPASPAPPTTTAAPVIPVITDIPTAPAKHGEGSFNTRLK